MRVAVAEGWMFALFETGAAAQAAFGAEWMAAATIALLIEMHPTFAGLLAAPGLDVAHAAAGAVGYFLLGMGVVELWARPVDDRGRLLDPNHPRAAACERLFVARVLLRGAELQEVRSA